MTVHSNDRALRETKLERLGKLAKERNDIVFNNLGHILDKDLLRKAYQKLNGKKAIGIDGISKEIYGMKLEERIQDLITRIRNNSYKPKPFRITEIPKEDGSTRPLAIASFEDKMVQMAVSDILTQIYEPLFLPCSYGYRPNKNTHDALRALMQHTHPCWNGAVIEIDICKYFDTIPHKELVQMLQKKISDRRFLQLINKLITAPVISKDKTITNKVGCRQGSILSPILANIFLHEVIDSWFHSIKGKHIAGKTELIRYADDMVFIFEKYLEAKRFFEVLPKRLEKFGLKIHLDKSRLIKSGQNNAKAAHRLGERLPTYQFLGFTVYWGKARNGKWWRIKLRCRRDRFISKLKGLRQFLKDQLDTRSTIGTLKQVMSVVRGWLNYYTVTDNERIANKFLNCTRAIIRQWLNRRGRKRPISWVRFNNMMKEINYPTVGKTISLFPKAC